MKAGSLVKYKDDSSDLGLVLGWYDSVHGYINVRWQHHGKYHISPCHISKLEIVSESG